jgi:hypothetical protein
MPRLLARFLSFAEIAASVVAGLLILTELALRALDFPSLRLDPIETRADFAYDPQLGWLPRPNSVKQQTASRTVTLRHNSLGLRDIELAPSEGPTVLFLGNSFVWGVEVETEERFTKRLRVALPGGCKISAAAQQVPVGCVSAGPENGRGSHLLDRHCNSLRSRPGSSRHIAPNRA